MGLCIIYDWIVYDKESIGIKVFYLFTLLDQFGPDDMILITLFILCKFSSLVY